MYFFQHIFSSFRENARDFFFQETISWRNLRKNKGQCADKKKVPPKKNKKKKIKKSSINVTKWCAWTTFYAIKWYQSLLFFTKKKKKKMTRSHVFVFYKKI